MDHLSFDDIRQLLALDECYANKKTSKDFVAPPCVPSCAKEGTDSGRQQAERDSRLIELLCSVDTLQKEFLDMKNSGDCKGVTEKEITDPVIKSRLERIRAKSNKMNFDID